ncbi:MAG: GTPase domain-containing protein [Phycisphaerales bacterium]|nr:GTPase domain-containing protein [Phycisphaerales bacterium]
MHEHVKRLFERATQLGQRAYEAGWITSAALRGLHQVEHRAPPDLFAPGGERPLVVALFGGTGAGKSSLLNRLAGASIARVGAERPTSREVTVFLHESVALNELPADLPMRDVRIARHANPAQRDVMWIDCPDIDSTITANRAMALAWLTHVDLVIYVVSPERYRDDAGWRVLKERGGRHGWAFVMNRADEARPEQRADFERELRQAGFGAPRVFMTTCRAGAIAPHDFEGLAVLIGGLVSSHAVRELERRGLRSRLLELCDALRRAFETLGNNADWQALAAQWGRRWGVIRESMLGGVQFPLRGIAQRIARSVTPAAHPVSQALTARLTGSLTPPARGAVGSREYAEAVESSPPGVEAIRTALWDGVGAARLSEALDGLEVDAAQRGLASLPLRRRIGEIVVVAPDVVCETLSRAASQVVAESGGDTRARIRGIFGALCYGLPVCALAWAGYLVVNRFYLATATTQPTTFLGADFAVHALLLVVIAWAAPFAGYVAFRSDPGKRVAQALERAFALAVDQLGEAARSSIAETGKDAAGVRGELEQLLNEIDRCANSGMGASPLVASLLPAGAESRGAR